MVQQVAKAQSEQSDKQTVVMRTILCMALEDIPDTKFEALIKLQTLNGCAALQKGQTYSHHSYVTEMENSLADVIRNKLSEEIGASPFVGVIIDETVNITNEKKMIIFLRYTIDGRPKTAFCGNYTLLAGDADTVFQKVSQVLREKGIDTRRVVGLASDGASVMFGRINGVGA